MPVSLYAAHAPAGHCLYVGQTTDPDRRRRQHQQDSDWAGEPGVRWSIVADGLTKRQADEAERRLIREWNPLHNTEHSLLGRIGKNARLAINAANRPNRITDDWIRQQWVNACRGARLEVRLPNGAPVRPMIGALTPIKGDRVWVGRVFPCEGVPLAWVKERATVINAGFRAHSTEIRLLAPNEGLIILAFDSPFDAVVPFEPVTPGTDALPFAVSMAGELVTIPLIAPNGAGNGIQIAGSSGSGKSNTVKAVLLQAVLHGGIDLWLADPKRVDLAPFHPVAARVETIRPGWEAMLQDTVAEMEHRYRWLEAEGFSSIHEAREHPDCPRPLWVVLEELNQITTPANARKPAVQALASIASLGRAAGVCPVVINQSTYVASLRGDIADNLSTWIVHAMKRQEQVRTATGGAEQEAPAHTLVMGDHLAYTEDPRTGESRLIKSMYVNDETLKRIVMTLAPPVDGEDAQRALESGETRPTQPPSPLEGDGGRVGLDTPTAAPVRGSAYRSGVSEPVVPVLSSERLSEVLSACGLESFEGDPVRRREHGLANGKGMVTRAKLGCWELEPHEPVPCRGCGRSVSWFHREDGHVERVGYVFNGVPVSLCRSCGGRVSRGG